MAADKPIQPVAWTNTLATILFMTLVAYTLTGAILALEVDSICKEQGFEQGKISLTFHQTCHSHKHYFGKVIPRNLHYRRDFHSMSTRPDAGYDSPVQEPEVSVSYKLELHDTMFATNALVCRLLRNDTPIGMIRVNTMAEFTWLSQLISSHPFRPSDL